MRDTLGKREIKKTLATGLKSEAIPRAQQLFLETQNLFQRMEKKRMASAPNQTKPVPAADILASLEGMSVSPDGSPQKITVTIGGSKCVIEGDNRDEEVKAAADLLRLAPSAPAPATPKGRPKKESTVALSAMIKAYFTEVKAAATPSNGERA